MYKRQVHFHKHIQESLPRLVRNGRIAPYDRISRDRVPETDHEVLTCGETEGLLVVVELEGENARVGGDCLFGVQDGFCPRFGLEEDFAGDGGGGGFGDCVGCEGGEGVGGQGADVVGWHHGFGGVGVCGIWLEWCGDGE